MKRAIYIFMGGLCCLLLSFCLTASAAETKSRYPVMSNDGLTRFVQEEGRGRPVLVSIFASWCGPCRKEMPQLVHLRSKVSQDEILIIGISADDNLFDLRNFLKEVKVNFPVYLGTPDLYSAYGIISIPQLLVFNAKGEFMSGVNGLLSDEDFNALVDKLIGQNNE